MDSSFDKRNKNYLQTRCSDDLTNYARRKLRKRKQPSVATPTVQQVLSVHICLYFFKEKFYSRFLYSK